MTYKELLEDVPYWMEPLFEKECFQIYGTIFKYFVKIEGMMFDHPQRIWCDDNFGKQREEWRFLACGYWCFKTKEDAVAFKLRWL